MVIIKIYSQDMYVATEVSIEHTEKIAKLLNIKENDVFFVGSEGTLVAEGVDQVNWFTYLEVSLPKSLESHRTELTTLFHEIFSNYGVHLMVKYEIYEVNNIVKIINPEFPVFNKTMVNVIPQENYFDEDEDEDGDFDDGDGHFH